MRSGGEDARDVVESQSLRMIAAHVPVNVSQVILRDFQIRLIAEDGVWKAFIGNESAGKVLEENSILRIRREQPLSGPVIAGKPL